MSATSIIYSWSVPKKHCFHKYIFRNHVEVRQNMGRSPCTLTSSLDRIVEPWKMSVHLQVEKVNVLLVTWDGVASNIVGEKLRRFSKEEHCEVELEYVRNVAMKIQKCVHPVLNLNSSITRNAIFANQMLLLHNGPDTIKELFERNMVIKEKIYDSDQVELNRRQRLTSTRREVLSLYRDIVRATRFFMWPDTRGVLWRDVLRDNARMEFEEARYERDPEVITRLIIGGRDSVQAALGKLVEKQKLEIAKEHDTQINR